MNLRTRTGRSFCSCDEIGGRDLPPALGGECLGYRRYHRKPVAGRRDAVDGRSVVHECQIILLIGVVFRIGNDPVVVDAVTADVLGHVEPAGEEEHESASEVLFHLAYPAV